MKNFLASASCGPLATAPPAAHRAVVTASLGVMRVSCAPAVPSYLSKLAVNTLLVALGGVVRSVRPRPSTTGTVPDAESPKTNGIRSTSAGGGGGGSGSRGRTAAAQSGGIAREPAAAQAAPNLRGCLELGADGFPDAQVAAFLIDATMAGGGGRGIMPLAGMVGPPRAAPPISLSAQLASRVRGRTRERGVAVLCWVLSI